MAAESLVELNPKEFNNMLYEDLPDNVRSRNLWSSYWSYSKTML